MLSISWNEVSYLSLGTFNNFTIKGISCVVPDNPINSEVFYDKFGIENVKKFVKMTGVKKRYIAYPEQTASDLCHVAAQRLLEKLSWERDSIDALIFITQTPDYRLPATACVLHKRLNLKLDCIAFDVNLGCSGYVYGLYIAGSLLQNQNIKRVLLLAGDTLSKIISDEDRSTSMLFGDSGSATALEKTENVQINYLFKTDGNGFKDIIVPSGVCRNMHGNHKRMLFDEGIKRSDYELYMNGTEVFNFTISEVPAAIKDIMNYSKVSIKDIDLFVLHQANLFMLQYIAKKTHIPPEKMPISIDRFGNTSVTSVPLTIVDACSNLAKHRNLHVLLSGFGVGLSWGVILLKLDTSACLSISYTKDQYNEGAL